MNGPRASKPAPDVRGITLDLYRTLLDHREGLGRGACYRAYLESHGLTADPWEHQVLYDVFEFYADAYDPASTNEEELRVWIEFTKVLFERTGVRGVPSGRIPEHAQGIRGIFGPDCFALYPEVRGVLARLRERGFRLGIASNWQRGLDHFCDELALSEYLDFVIASADIGFEKPAPEFFHEAVRRMRLPAKQILHVGDSMREDVEGARAAGLNAILLDRRRESAAETVTTIAELSELEELLV